MNAAAAPPATPGTDGKIARVRVAVVIESFDPMAGGNERSTDQIMRELVKRGHRVTLVTGCCKPADEPVGVTTRAMSRRKSSSAIRLAAFSRWARAQLAEGRFDTSLSMTMAVPAAVLQPRGGTVRETLARNVAMRGGGLCSRKKQLEILLDPKQQLLLALERKTLRHAAVYRVAALSQYVVRQLQQHYGFPAERTVVIPNAAVVPDADAGQRQAWRRAVRERFDVSDSATLFLLAAQNPSLKGYPTLLEALRKLRERGAPGDSGGAVALLAGGFGDTQRAEAQAAGVGEMVRLVGQSKEMPTLFAAADVTVLPTWYDPSSKVVLESLMMGTPAISTAYNGASDHLAPADGAPRGLVISDPGSAEQLAQAMARLMDPAFRAACSEACAGLADQLSMTRHVDALERVLADAAAKGREAEGSRS